MNIFRFIADMLHLAAIVLLMYRIKKSRNCIGKYIITRIGHLLEQYPKIKKNKQLNDI